MTKVNERGYVVRSNRFAKSAVLFRDWWLPKYSGRGDLAIELGTVSLPLKYAGQRVRFKIEVIEDKTVEA